MEKSILTLILIHPDIPRHVALHDFSKNKNFKSWNIPILQIRAALTFGGALGAGKSLGQ